MTETVRVPGLLLRGRGVRSSPSGIPERDRSPVQYRVPDDGQTHKADTSSRGIVVPMHLVPVDRQDRQHEEHSSIESSEIRQQAGTQTWCGLSQQGTIRGHHSVQKVYPESPQFAANRMRNICGPKIGQLLQVCLCTGSRSTGTLVGCIGSYPVGLPASS